MDGKAFHELIAPYNKRITVDIGTGDGLFVFKWAQRDPNTFFIGVDANRRPLQKISEKIHRRPAKGGLLNVLFLQAAVDDLPAELEGIATEVLVQFPWGSLLRGVAAGGSAVMSKLRHISAANAQLHVTIGMDLERDKTEWRRLGQEPISLDYVNSILAARYLEAGFRIVGAKEESLSELTKLQTSWARRLQGSASRSLMTIAARAVGE